ncbi:hypothetical protein [Burkholderia arboris]|uniref:hypothetical protein n=1 Tax=Burkholderia arboris TaxID=488730 RepID=UPI001CF19B81|nr:hypothetical protein [Burkholderia arboris]MCA8045465.1 hypothetical protein [Burkholderia arboris]
MGKKFIACDANGVITGLYDSEDSPPPMGESGVIAITDAQWAAYATQQTQWRIENGVLVQNPAPTAAQQLSEAKVAQNAVLNSSCARAIVSGFSSNALGAVFSYPSGITDQSNQNTIAQYAGGGLLWCASNGAWMFKQHTQTQAQAVVGSFVDWLNKCQSQLVAYSERVNAATTVADVQLIGWADPN